MSERTKVALAVCTFRRNEALERLLSGALECAERVRDRAALGAVIVDDTPEGLARRTAEDFADRFELGLTYVISGKRNISIARNLALETAIRKAEWIAITDDDCEPSPEWLAKLLEVQQRTQADTVSGMSVRKAPTGSPRWICEQPFLGFLDDQFEDGAILPTGFTNNSLISSAWLRKHPHVRFDEKFGRTGGEDMVFFRQAKAAGMDIRFAREAKVFEEEPPERLTFGYQLRRSLWLGNTSYLTSRKANVSPLRMAIHAGGVAIRAVARPVRRLLTGQPPHWRFALASLLKSVGIVAGLFGIRIRHH